MVFKQNTRFIRKASGFLKRGRKNKEDRSSHETSSFAAAAVPHFANTLAVFNVSLEESRVWMPFLPCECISRRKTPCVVQYRQRVQTNLQRTSATPVKGYSELARCAFLRRYALFKYVCFTVAHPISGSHCPTGFRAGTAGGRCEAVVSVPSLLSKYPFPFIVNAVFLKLADLFCNRYYILSTNFNRIG